MSKATLTFTDLEDGSMNVSCEFDPPLPRDSDAEVSVAQASAVMCVQFMNARASGPDELEEFLGELIEEGSWDEDTIE